MLIGLAIAAPVGPIGVLCIRRTLTQGRLYGLVSGLGAASADAVFGFIAAFGVAFLTNLLLDAQNVLRLGGGAFLVYLGVLTLRARPASEAAAVRSGSGLLAAYASTFGLTLTNPMTILSFTAIFASINPGASGDVWGGFWIVAGVFCGSALWWLTLSGGVGLLRSRLGPALLVWVNRFSGAILIVFGALSMLSAISGT